MGYSAKAVANFFLDRADEDGRSLTPLQVIKLTYIAHGWNLAITDEPLVDDEYAEAWKYGPVFPSLYHEFKHFGRDSIKSRAKEFVEAKHDEFAFDLETPVIANEDIQTFRILKSVWNEYKRFSGIELSKMTHAPDTPWDKVRRKNNGISRRNLHIDDKLIQQHYLEMIIE